MGGSNNKVYKVIREPNFMNTSLLREIGLSDGEVRVYFSLLELGESKTGKISVNARVHTSKVYLILDKLIKKGLVSYVIKNKIKYYRASDPKQILGYLHNKKRVLDEQEKNLKEILPNILKRQKYSKEKQSASVYEGVKGIKTLFEEMLDDWKKGEDYLVFSPGEEFKNEELNEFFKKHHLKRIEKGIIVRSISLESQRNFYKEKYRGIKNFQFRFTDFSLPAGINIVGKNVSTLIYEPFPTAFVIQSKFIAQRYKDFFYRLWEISKK